MTKFRTIICCVLLTFALSVVGVLPVSAAASQSVSLTTSPISVDLAGKPGSSVTTTLQVMNNNPVPLDITMDLQTFRAYGDTGKAQIYTPTSNDNFINWVTFSHNTFLAQPGVWTPIQMTINLPSYAALDYYYAVLFKPSVPVSAGKHTNVLKSSNAILVLLNANSPNEHPEVQVKSFTSSKKIYEYLPANLNIDVYNNGNTYLAPTGDVYISRSSNFNTIIDSLNINYAGGNILPGTNRIYTVQWTDGFPVFTPKTIAGQQVQNNSGQLVEQLKWNFSQTNKFRFGKYYAKMVLVYNNGTRDVPIYAIVSFWVIPWKLIIGIILFIALIVGLVIFAIYVSHKQRKQTKWHV